MSGSLEDAMAWRMGRKDSVFIHSLPYFPQQLHAHVEGDGARMAGPTFQSRQMKQ